jgi:hypothetical protein
MSPELSPAATLMVSPVWRPLAAQSPALTFLLILHQLRLPAPFKTSVIGGDHRLPGSSAFVLVAAVGCL